MIIEKPHYSRRDFTRLGLGALGSIAMPYRAAAQYSVSKLDVDETMSRYDGPIFTNLAVGIDASQSVDAEEWDLQIEGTAAALQSDIVKGKILDVGAIGIFGFNFSFKAQQITPYAVLKSAEDCDRYAQHFRSAARSLYPSATDISRALNTVGQLMALTPHHTSRSVVDIGFDGINSHGSRPVRSEVSSLAEQGITVNGLVINTNHPSSTNLIQYSDETVITPWQMAAKHGIGEGRSFVAYGYNDIYSALIRKFPHDIAGLDQGPSSFG